MVEILVLTVFCEGVDAAEVEGDSEPVVVCGDASIVVVLGGKDWEAVVVGGKDEVVVDSASGSPTKIRKGERKFE